MVCLGLEPRVAGWKAHRNPLSYGGTPIFLFSVSLSCSLLLPPGRRPLHPVPRARDLVPARRHPARHQQGGSPLVAGLQGRRVDANVGRSARVYSGNTHQMRKYNCTADLLIDWFGFDPTSKYVAKST